MAAQMCEVGTTGIRREAQQEHGFQSVCSNKGLSSNEGLRGAATSAQPRRALSIDLLHNDDCL